MKNKTILITGASGLIGQHFLWSIDPMENTVYAVHYRPLPPHLLIDGVIWLQGDLTDVDFLNKLPYADIIIHAATYSSPLMFLQNPIGTLRLNMAGTMGLIDRLEKDGRLLFLSSSEVNNDVKGSQRAYYIGGKKSGETLCRLSRKNIKIVRLSHVYGEMTRLDDSRVLYDFVKQALAYGGITVKGNASHRRYYCYVGDAVEMMWNVLLKGESSVYDIGGEVAITIEELAKNIGELTNTFVVSTDKVIKDGSFPDEVVDMTTYNNEFGRYDYTPLKVGLKRVIDWFKVL